MKRLQKGEYTRGRDLVKANRESLGLTRTGRKKREKETLDCICPSRWTRDIKCDAPKHM